MKSFKQLLEYTLDDVSGPAHMGEPGLPTLSDDDGRFLGTYIKKLDAWITRRDIFAGNFLSHPKAMKRIPKKLRRGGVLYRGIAIKEDAWFNFINTKKLKPHPVSSWSREIETGEGFAETGFDEIGIVFQKRIKDVVLDVRAFVNDKEIRKQAQAIDSDEFRSTGLGQGEAEVIVALKTPLTIKDVHHVVIDNEEQSLEYAMALAWDDIV